MKEKADTRRKNRPHQQECIQPPFIVASLESAPDTQALG